MKPSLAAPEFARRTLVYGLPGTGKTTFLHQYVTDNPGHRYFIVDRADEWGPDAPHWGGDVPELHIIEGEDNVPEEFDEEGVYVFRELEGLQVAQLVCDVGDAVYLDDEIDLVGGKSGWEDSPLRRLVHQGRHLRNRDGVVTECHLLGACRRPQSLHLDLSDQADAVYVFRVQGSRTLERLIHDNHIEKDEWDTVRTLPNFHFKAWPAGEFLQLKPIGEEPQTGPRSPVAPLPARGEEPYIRVY